jgi:hypothetical protein
MIYLATLPNPRVFLGVKQLSWIWKCKTMWTTKKECNNFYTYKGESTLRVNNFSPKKVMYNEYYSI